MEILLLIVLVVVVIWTILSKPDKTNTYYESPEEKGLNGENDVKKILSYLPKEEYIVLNDVLLPLGNGMTQVDHIVVSLYGIFVIETKNYSGKIYGGKSSAQWKQYIRGEEFTFQNPLIQNQVHVDAVMNKTHQYQNHIIPIVVFTGDAVIKAEVGTSVVHISDLLSTITQYNDKVFTFQQIDYYARVLDAAIEETDDRKHAHIQTVRDRIIQKDLQSSVGSCPLCQGNLVLRHGKYGPFYGCSNYPKCRYTRNVDSYKQ